jgi:hypothetical protein
MQVVPLKDEDGEHAVAEAWRPVIREIVKAFAEGDYELARGISPVVPPSPTGAARMRAYVADYGETLAEFPMRRGILRCRNGCERTGTFL